MSEPNFTSTMEPIGWWREGGNTFAEINCPECNFHGQLCLSIVVSPWNEEPKRYTHIKMRCGNCRHPWEYRWNMKAEKEPCK
jgi:hypothetical protein